MNTLRLDNLRKEEGISAWNKTSVSRSEQRVVVSEHSRPTFVSWTREQSILWRPADKAQWPVRFGLDQRDTHRRSFNVEAFSRMKTNASSFQDDLHGFPYRCLTMLPKLCEKLLHLRVHQIRLGIWRCSNKNDDDDHFITLLNCWLVSND